MAQLKLDVDEAEPPAEQGEGRGTPLSPAQRRLAAAVYDMAVSERQQVEYIHSTFASVSLPRSEVKGRLYERTVGAASLQVQAGSLWDGQTWIEQPVPYGPKPRMIMVHISTYATRHRSKEIPIGESFAEFMRMLGVSNINGGERGSRTSYRRQIMALAAATLRMGFATKDGARTMVTQPFNQFELWSQGQGTQRTLWPGTITLSQDYFESLLEHSFPIDGRALHALGTSALAMDIYMWLASRLYRLDKPLLIHWPGLYQQFGGEISSLKDFKKKFVVQLTRALAVYPDAKVEIVHGGLMLRNSAPPVARTTRISLARG